VSPLEQWVSTQIADYGAFTRYVEAIAPPREKVWWVAVVSTQPPEK
jgi:hypothetical protein